MNGEKISLTRRKTKTINKWKGCSPLIQGFDNNSRDKAGILKSPPCFETTLKRQTGGAG